MLCGLHVGRSPPRQSVEALEVAVDCRAAKAPAILVAAVIG